MQGAEADLALLMDAAHVGAEVAMSYFGQSPEAWQKAGGQGPVSAADLAVDTLLKDRLMRARPDYGWLSEETADAPHRLARQRCFIVDPIDGTTSFLKRQNTWAISVAVVEDGVPIAGVVMMPATDQTYSAARGQVALCNGQALSLATSRTPPLIAMPNNQMGAEYWTTEPDHIAAVRAGALALRLTRLAEGDVDGTVTFRKVWEWDIAAGVLIAQQAGAVVTDRKGNPLRFNSQSAQLDGMIAANGALQSDLVGRASDASA